MSVSAGMANPVAKPSAAQDGSNNDDVKARCRCGQPCSTRVRQDTPERGAMQSLIVSIVIIARETRKPPRHGTRASVLAAGTYDGSRPLITAGRGKAAESPPL